YILSAIKSRTGSKLTTMEGLPQLCRIAGANFEKISGPDSFEIIQGLYDETFPKLMKRTEVYDVVFIDGNHKKKPTLDYFNLLKTKTSDKAVFVFDDINWDKEMKEAWRIIQADTDINFSIDLYKLGIVLIDKTTRPQHVNAELFYAY
ncbi:MAG: class I SAM-dependent methyltransferase, partial [Flavobacterium sp.]